MPLESPFWCLSRGINLISPRLEIQKLYSKYYIFCTYFSNISVFSLSNDILLYTVGKLFSIPIQWYYSHIPTVVNAKVIFKIHHFIVFNSNIGVGQEWQDTIPEMVPQHPCYRQMKPRHLGLTSSLTYGEAQACFNKWMWYTMKLLGKWYKCQAERTKNKLRGE